MKKRIILAVLMLTVAGGSFFAGTYYMQGEAYPIENSENSPQDVIDEIISSDENLEQEDNKEEQLPVVSSAVEEISSSVLEKTEPPIETLPEKVIAEPKAVSSSSVPIEVESNNADYTEIPISDKKEVKQAPIAIQEEVSSMATTETDKQSSNSDSPFGNYEVTVYDSTKPAVRSTGYGWPMTTFSFIAEDGTDVGSITSEAYKEIKNQNKVFYSGSSLWNAPDANGDWDVWFADIFNEYRGLDYDAIEDYNEDNSHSDSNNIDTDAYAMEVIDLVNEKREELGLNILEVDDSLMEHSQIRAEELSIQFSHERPNGTVETNECAGKGSKTPTKVFQGWLNSDPHRDAILNESGRFLYNYIGTGCYQAENGTFYWIITFGK